MMTAQKGEAKMSAARDEEKLLIQKLEALFGPRGAKFWASQFDTHEAARQQVRELIEQTEAEIREEDERREEANLKSARAQPFLAQKPANFKRYAAKPFCG
jgi:hypothetical protein